MHISVGQYIDIFIYIVIFIDLVTDTVLLFCMIYRAIDIPQYWLTLSRANNLLHLRKMAEHLDFDKELLAKKGLPNWSYGLTSDTCKDASTKWRMCRICWKSQKRKIISCKGGNTSNLFSHSMITSNIVINLKVQYIVE